VVMSVLAEALLLSVAGGLLGALCAWLFFNGHISSMQIGTTTPIAFAVAVTPHLVIHGVLWACVIGFAGGLCPAIHAARLPVARALNTVV